MSSWEDNNDNYYYTTTQCAHFRGIATLLAVELFLHFFPLREGEHNVGAEIFGIVVQSASDSSPAHRDGHNWFFKSTN